MSTNWTFPLPLLFSFLPSSTLSYPVLSCLVLSCLVLSCLVLSCPNRVRCLLVVWNLLSTQVSWSWSLAFCGRVGFWTVVLSFTTEPSRLVAVLHCYNVVVNEMERKCWKKINKNYWKGSSETVVPLSSSESPKLSLLSQNVVKSSTQTFQSVSLSSA